MERIEYRCHKLKPLYLHFGIKEVKDGGQAICRGACNKASGNLLSPLQKHVLLSNFAAITGMSCPQGKCS